MKKQVERTYCDWAECGAEADYVKCAICRKDFCFEHLDVYSNSASLAHPMDRSKPYRIGFCVDCAKQITPDGFLEFGVIT